MPWTVPFPLVLWLDPDDSSTYTTVAGRATAIKNKANGTVLTLPDPGFPQWPLLATTWRNGRRAFDVNGAETFLIANGLSTNGGASMSLAVAFEQVGADTFLGPLSVGALDPVFGVEFDVSTDYTSGITWANYTDPTGLFYSLDAPAIPHNAPSVQVAAMRTNAKPFVLRSLVNGADATTVDDGGATPAPMPATIQASPMGFSAGARAKLGVTCVWAGDIGDYWARRVSDWLRYEYATT